MTSVIDLQTYLTAAASRLLVMVDLQQKNHDELADDPGSELAYALENCASAIRHARDLGMPIAFTRLTPGAGNQRAAQSPWIPGFEPKRADMVFERSQPSCYANPLFEDVVSKFGSFAIAGLGTEQAGLATAVDASPRGHHVTFLSDASASRGRHGMDAGAVHVLVTKTIGLFADTIATRHWLAAMSPKNSKGYRYG